MAYLSEQERVSLLMMRGWGDLQRSYNEVRQLFNDTFRNETPISKSTVVRTIQRFEETGSVKNRIILGRPRSTTNEEKALDVAQSFVEDQRLSIRKAAQQHEISRMSTQRILKLIKFHPYKIHLVQELNEDDFDRRNEFCELIMQKIDEEPNFLFNIIFSDEATFEMNGNVNRHNCRFWSDDNPHWILQARTQYPEKLNVWAGILNNTLIGPFFINGNLTSAKYEDMLRNEILPAIQAIVGDNFDQIWFQQDGAAPHYGREVRNYLNEVFPNRWIGRKGRIEWPPRSPDLSPLDYFLWGHLKGKVYKTKPQNLEELRNRILEESALIEPDCIRNSVSNFYDRIALCQTVNGAHFEQLV